MVRMSCEICVFKQKTAYEWRISDWSSDVCSSDLSSTPRGWRASSSRPATRCPTRSSATPTFATPSSPCRSEEHTSELQSLMRISYAVFCLQKKNKNKKDRQNKQLYKAQNHSYNDEHVILDASRQKRHKSTT